MRAGPSRPFPAAILVGLVRLHRAALSLRPARPGLPDGAIAFTGGRTGLDAASCGLLACASIPEIGVLHLILRHWSPVLARAATLAEFWLLVLMLGAGRSLSRFSTLLFPDRLLLRYGAVREWVVPLSAVTGARPRSGRPDRAPGRVRFWFLDEPTVTLGFRDAAGHSREADLRLDDPAAFLSALDRDRALTEPSRDP